MSLTLNWENVTLKYDQLYSMYPALDVFYPFSFEKEWIGYPYSDFCRETMVPILGICCLYVVLCFGGQKIMANREPFDLKYVLATWNLALSLFSFMGAARTVPHLLNNIYTQGFEYSACASSDVAYGLGPSGMWTTLFIFSKIPELFDTMFIVLRKRPLIFLHWYHHITVLAYCWHAYATRASSGLYFVAMNFTVHAVMYLYYCLSGLKMVPKFVNPMWITILQLSQMVIGIYVCVSVYLYQSNGVVCNVEKENLMAAGLMYFSYFLLFLKFFIQRFFMAAPAKKTASKANPKAKAE